MGAGAARRSRSMCMRSRAWPNCACRSGSGCKWSKQPAPRGLGRAAAVPGCAAAAAAPVRDADDDADTAVATDGWFSSKSEPESEHGLLVVAARARLRCAAVRVWSPPLALRLAPGRGAGVATAGFGLAAKNEERTCCLPMPPMLSISLDALAAHRSTRPLKCNGWSHCRRERSLPAHQAPRQLPHTFSA